MESEEKFREELKKNFGLEEPIRLVKLSRGGIRIFCKDLSRLSPGILSEDWPGSSIAGCWAFFPGGFQAIPSMISSG